MIEIDLPANKLPLDTIKERVSTVFKNYDVDKAYIYGSYVNGGFDFTSDYDLLIDGFNNYTDFYEKGKTLRKMQRDLESLNVLDRQVDISLVSTLEQRSMNKLDQAFKDNVNRDKVLIYGK
ncbi:nucleotidyltransferase domain-containing protein [Weissella coleopterorum]|uniref:Nucleotidyltransferase domain-containing protein n=1 Tax=Weissella coleopterorum TaxID=2714949 RepID=A0A6G8AXV0_9LACO|nr:nucleotidyltransferase domain-containing protein [Weissella coleopterorum]QIL49931.1 nucleotidyltransferase domain-containing protein [Weissella coleopterorum]